MIKKDNLIKLINSKKETSKLLLYTYNKLKTDFGELFAKQKNYNQNNPHHCYDLLSHTIHSLYAIQDMPLKKEEKDILLVAAFFHDIAKPICMIDKGNRYVFYNHEELSADIAEDFLIKIGFNNDERNLICFLIKEHGIFMPFRLKSERFCSNNLKVISNESVNQLYNELSDEYGTGFDVTVFNMLCNLSIADCEAQSDEVIINGNIVETKSNKIKRINEIKKLANKIRK